MATKRRTDYRVDEDALKRMMAGGCHGIGGNSSSG